MSASRKPHPIEALSFVRDRAPQSRTDLRRCFWNVQSTGDHRRDGALGQALAIEYLRYLVDEAHQGDSHGYLGWIVTDMPAQHTPIEIGFLHVIDHAARHGLIYAERLAADYERCRVAETHGSLVNQRPDGSVVIEQPDGKRAVYRKVGAA